MQVARMGVYKTSANVCDFISWIVGILARIQNYQVLTNLREKTK